MDLFLVFATEIHCLLMNGMSNTPDIFTAYELFEVELVCYVAQISCGGTHSVALTRDGRMFSVSTFHILFAKAKIVKKVERRETVSENRAEVRFMT